MPDHKAEMQLIGEFVLWLDAKYPIQNMEGFVYRDPIGEPSLDDEEMKAALWDEFAVATGRPQVHQLEKTGA